MMQAMVLSNIAALEVRQVPRPQAKLIPLPSPLKRGKPKDAGAFLPGRGSLKAPPHNK